ncbi:hypothetical protein BaRGS_00038550 [Batillaria attramentaria]|uniref:Uncharacterized protein n=2 Tax=Batillaria attramentaria TaxID=370345 RepID=A0ABD0J6W9_9CAEN|nr:hypothetical protein BaRGS_016679 [Batillaria attramentaria]
MSTPRDKRAASSPVENLEKRAHVASSFLDDSQATIADDSQATIINPDFMSSTLVDKAPSLPLSPLNEEIKSVFFDPEVVEILSKALSAQVAKDLGKEIAELKQEIRALKQEVLEKDEEIRKMSDRIDELEQYGRRNSVRIYPIPESAIENTDEIAIKVANSVGVKIEPRDIDRSHRVGRKPSPTDTYTRPVLVKFTSYKVKEALMRARRGLGKIDAAAVFPNVDWPSLPKQPVQHGRPSSTTNKIYVNDDLTATRATLAAKARKLKKDNKIDDTWSRDGVVFLKKNDSVHRLTTLRELAPFDVA